MDELRRGYHDRIASLRDQTLGMVRDATASVEIVAAARADPESPTAAPALTSASTAVAQVAEIETTVLELLALQAPVARDLRVIMAALHIAQLSELCLGLCRTLAEGVGRGDDVRTPELRRLEAAIGTEAGRLLADAGAAWAALDAGIGTVVLESADTGRQLQRRFLAALFTLDGVPVDAAVDLGMASRAYGRLIDHALEIAERVLFAATGVHAAVAEEA